MFSFYKWREKEISVLVSCLFLRQHITPEAVFDQLLELKPDLILKTFKDRNFLKIRKVLEKLEKFGYLVKAKDKWFVRNQDVASKELFDNSKYVYWTEKNIRPHNHGEAKLTFSKWSLKERQTKSIRGTFIIEILSLCFENSFTSWSSIQDKFNISRYDVNKIETTGKETVKLRHDFQGRNAVPYSKTKISFDIGLKISLNGEHRCGYQISKHLAERLRIPRKACYTERGQQRDIQSSNVKGLYDFMDEGCKSFLMKRSNESFDYKIKRCKKKWSQIHNYRGGNYNYSYVKDDEHKKEIKHVRSSLFISARYNKRLDRFINRAHGKVYQSSRLDLFTGY